MKRDTELFAAQELGPRRDAALRAVFKNAWSLKHDLEINEAWLEETILPMDRYAEIIGEMSYLTVRQAVDKRPTETLAQKKGSIVTAVIKTTDVVQRYSEGRWDIYNERWFRRGNLLGRFGLTYAIAAESHNPNQVWDWWFEAYEETNETAEFAASLATISRLAARGSTLDALMTESRQFADEFAAQPEKAADFMQELLVAKS